MDSSSTLSARLHRSTDALSHDPPTPARPERNDAHILYVDDDATAREAFSDAASHLGYRVDTADGGGEALAKVDRHRYAVIAADLRMPILNGLSLIQLLRPKLPEASFLIVTGASLPDLPVQPNGEPLVDDVVCKPWTLSGLAKQLKRALGVNRERRARTPVPPHELPILVLESVVTDGRGLRRALAEGLPETACRYVQNLSQAVEHIETGSFRCAIVDLEIADSGGLEIIASLRREASDLPLIVVGHIDDEAVRHQVYKAGAQDYLIAQEIAPYSLRRAVDHVFDKKLLEDRLEYLASRDPVTGLANRASAREQIARAVSRAHSEENTKVALLVLDLDRFKAVNDSLGHELGDRLLKVVADRLRDNLRDADMAARLGGDEFAIILERIHDESEAVATAQRLLEALTPPARLGSYEIASTGSIGIAIYPDHGETVGELLQLADRAMYRAKKGGRDAYALYTEDGEESRSGVLERLHFESGIRYALERDEYVVFFQPQMTLDRTRLVGMEALVRWNHPKSGLVPPGRFMPFLESSGLIKGVGEWVLRTACEQVKIWQEEVLPELRVSVNLSARQFEGTDLVTVVERALLDSGLDPTSLELEITESLLMRDTERTRATLYDLKALGVRIAVDDFGTGYSSLAYLTTFPLDSLKIDRSFVHDITTNCDDRTVAEAIIGLGHSLRLDVIAEGVETEEQLELLKGCDGFQGFLIGRPQAAEASRALIERCLADGGA